MRKAGRPPVAWPPHGGRPVDSTLSSICNVLGATITANNAIKVNWSTVQQRRGESRRGSTAQTWTGGQQPSAIQRVAGCEKMARFCELRPAVGSPKPLLPVPPPSRSRCQLTVQPATPSPAVFNAQLPTPTHPSFAQQQTRPAMGNALRAPVINDVSTDLADPPAFTASKHQATLPDSVKRACGRAYAHLKPVAVPGGDPAAVIAAAKRAAAALPRARVVHEDAAAGVLELLDVTLLMRFKDDVAVRQGAVLPSLLA